MSVVVRWLLVAVCLVLPVSASAQQFEFEALRFHPTASQRTGYFTMDSGRTLPGGGWELGLMGVYTNDQLNANRDGERLFAVIADQWALSLHGAWAFIDNLQLGFSLPFYVRQTTEAEGLVNNIGLEDAGVGDLRLVPKWTFLRGSYGGNSGFDMGLLVELVLPTGNSAALQGESFRLEPILALEYVWASQWALSANLGYLIRTKTRTFGNLDVNNQFTYGLGLKIPLIYDLFHLILEGRGGLTTGAEDLGEEENPLELNGGVRLYPGNFIISAGAGTGLVQGYGAPDYRLFLDLAFSMGDEENDRDGDGYADDEDGCPDDPEDFDEFQDADGCPDPDNDNDGILDISDACPLDPEDLDGWEDADGCPDPDNDGDGYLDIDDQCPDEAEDFDDYQDADGCPDPDNDGDGILDIDDQCPNTAEDLDGYEDEDGCPEEGPVTLRPSVIEITQQIQFDYDSDRIRSESDRIIDAVAEILLTNPEITEVRIEGHTSTEGSAAHNLDLSQRRARAVLDALVDRGVERSRLTSEGYGATRPLVTPDVGDRAALETNRRVEFHIVERND